MNLTTIAFVFGIFFIFDGQESGMLFVMPNPQINKWQN